MKKIIAWMLTLACLLCMLPSAVAASEEATKAAETLHGLGLFQGTGTDAKGNPLYDLDRTPTRAEAVTMLVRLLGKEEQAKQGSWRTPFSDVPDWAVPYVGYAYENGLTSGTSETTFSGEETVTATQYLTLVLRALGYVSGEDFVWDQAWVLSDQIGITDGQYSAESRAFLRADVAVVSKDALSTKLKDTDGTLLERIQADTALPDEKGEEPSTPPKRDDEETAFGDKALKEFLLSLNPSNCEWQMGGYFDHYTYQGRYFADELYDEILKYIPCVAVKEEYKKSTAKLMGTRVTCTDNAYYGRNVSVQTFSEDGMYYAKIFYSRLESR